jgi:hypothetical protein
MRLDSMGVFVLYGCFLGFIFAFAADNALLCLYASPAYPIALTIVQFDGTFTLSLHSGRTSSIALLKIYTQSAEFNRPEDSEDL